MADTIASVDAGNGGTNGVLHKTRGKNKTVYFPSVRAAATGDSLGLGDSLEMDYEYVDWGGHRYVVGDDVIRVTRRHLERHIGGQRYGNEFHQFLVANALARMGVKKGTVNLTVFAPPGMYLKAKKNIQEMFLDNNGMAAIHIKGEDKPRVWTYTDVDVLPEGIGAAACFALDDKGNPTDSEMLTGETVILDLGVFTGDALKMSDGNFNPESLEHATWDNAGLNTHILQPVVRILKKQSDEFDSISTDDIDATIRKGLDVGNWVVAAGGAEVDIEPVIGKYAERYAEWLANNIVDGVFNGLRGIKSCILVGGGATLVDNHLRTWYGNKILNPRDSEATKTLHPVEMNAVGGLRLALMREAQKE